MSNWAALFTVECGNQWSEVVAENTNYWHQNYLPIVYSLKVVDQCLNLQWGQCCHTSLVRTEGMKDYLALSGTRLVVHHSSWHGNVGCFFAMLLLIGEKKLELKLIYVHYNGIRF